MTGSRRTSSGNVWTIGGGTAYLAEVNSAGVQNTAVRPGGAYGLGSTFYSLALDGSGNLWIADQHNHGVWQYEIATSTFVTTAGINYPNGPGPFSNEAAFNNATHPTSIAVDGAGHKWVANKSAGGAASVTELSADGLTNYSPDDGFGSGIIADAYVVAIDPSGNVWVTNGGTTITQFVGAGAPTRTPIASAVNSGFTP